MELPDLGRKICRLILALASGTALAPTTAQAAPEEIQVYMDEMSEPGHFGLDVHTSFVASGDKTPDYPGQQQSVSRFRITPEFSLGLTRALELGLYLPLATIGNDGRLRADGAKARLKFIAPARPGSHLFWGANFEIGRVARRLDENPWNAEFKAIAGYRRDRWTMAVNANVDFKVSGPAPAPASLELATKLSYALRPRLALGVENYNGLGEFRDFGNVGGSEHSSYVTLDAGIGKWDLNLGVGTAYGTSTDGVILKAIIGIPID